MYLYECHHSVFIPQAFRILVAQGMEFFITTWGLVACGGLRRIEFSSECKSCKIKIRLIDKRNNDYMNTIRMVP